MISSGDQSILISLKDDNNLWSSFHANTTEMIVTKPGRKIFPKLTLNISGLNPNGNYGIKIVLQRADKYKYRFASGKWSIGNEEEEQEGAISPVVYHCDGFIQSGSEWMRRPVQFHHFKLTNNIDVREKHMVFVQSLHKYIPIVEISEFHPHLPPQPIRWQSLDLASFIVVTAYQNDAIKRLKVDHNPFAAGLRQKSRSPNTSSSSESECSRKRPSTSPIPSPVVPPPSFLHTDFSMLNCPLIHSSLPSDPLIQFNPMIPPFYPPMPLYPYPIPSVSDDFQFNYPTLPQ